MRIFFSAGEASGDAYGAALLLGVLKRIKARPRQSTEELLLNRLAFHYGILNRESLSEKDFSRTMDDVDSLGVVEQIMKLEDEFGIKVDDGDIPNPYSYAEMVRVLGRKVEAQWPDEIQVQAIGGRLLRAAGAQIIADSTTWGAIGVAESLKVYPRARAGLRKAQRSLAAGKPGVFVPIDYGYMNIGLARLAKERGWKVVYFSPPGAWRKDKQGEDLPKVTDCIITPFSWSAEILNRMGANAHWFGHPIRQMIRDSGNDERGSNRRSNIAILPGSRPSEIDLLLPVFARAIRDFPDAAEIAVAPSLDVEVVRTRWQKYAPNRQDTFTVGDTYGALKRARAAIVCSGTATLEAALCGCPHLVAYKVSKLVEIQARLIRFRVSHIAQPNIFLERRVVPELIQHAATPKAIADHLRRLLEDSGERQAQMDSFEELASILGPDDAIDRSAERIADYLRDLSE